MILDRFRLDGRVAVVTGAGRGIGAATAVALAEAGADVVIASRTRGDLDQVALSVSGTGRTALPVPSDLSKPHECAGLARAAIERFGRLDIVVNNVGGTMPRPLTSTTVEAMEEAFRFNVSSAHALTVAAAPHLVASGHGAVVNVTSTMGWAAGRGFAAYGTAKAALAHYTELTAWDLAPRVRVNAVAPGSVLTSALEVVASSKVLRESMEQATPLKRLGDPHDVAAAIVFLASDAAAYITGALINVDGGLNSPNLDLRLPDVQEAGA
ncbi:MAG TPA: SDR family oxidoreductase [Rugosimonospora sp.]|nr:SDR family oxidoreductase [Rugosimonospora sp.]